MNENGSFDDFMARLDAGSYTAAFRLFQLYGQRLIALARSRLDERIRQKLDPDDLVLSVLNSFLIRNASGDYDLTDWGGLWTLLVRITINKCMNGNQHFRTLKRNVGIEVAAQAGDGMSAAGWDFIDRQPQPHEAAVLTETMQLAMRGLDDTECKIIEMWLQGYSHREIASELKQPQASVQRTIARVRARLQRMLS